VQLPCVLNNVIQKGKTLRVVVVLSSLKYGKTEIVNYDCVPSSFIKHLYDIFGDVKSSKQSCMENDEILLWNSVYSLFAISRISYSFSLSETIIEIINMLYRGQSGPLERCPNNPL
jgi:hypothetical protein